MPNDDYIMLSDALKAILGVSIYDTIEELEGARTIAENTWADGLYDAYKIIEEEVDIADVEPVRHGRWIRVTNGRGGFECSLCSGYAASYQSGSDYLSAWCPNCGAKMDADPPKEEEDNDNKNL